MVIRNAKDLDLTQSTGILPDMSGTLLGWFIPMIFIQIVKSTVNHRIVEARTQIEFMGVWQPMSQEKINLKPEGQRSWKWFTVHSDISLILENDEIITYQNTDYRVDGNTNYSEYGYVEYSLVEDFNGA